MQRAWVAGTGDTQIPPPSPRQITRQDP